MTRVGGILAGVGFLLWALSPLLWLVGSLRLDASLFLGSTALLPWMIYLSIRRRSGQSAG
ncbi:hypothetical protein E0H26_09850 [Micromonospora zingiberis]|uniref:Uncharacterized protein n=1 Tax=Micromonospora zingiberis TaxID=2053011 RepID=A0A4R0GM01_9ACTN|nr:hypothetical protein [Micromonospora zingiberis]TCB97897.1 hypothetical protein E0H26_09850 [Micromonospora zingiberis]